MYLVLHVYSENSHRKLAVNSGRERGEGRQVVKAGGVFDMGGSVSVIFSSSSFSDPKERRRANSLRVALFHNQDVHRYLRPLCS